MTTPQPLSSTTGTNAPFSLPPGRLGATPLDDGSTRFEVWAPHATQVEVVLGQRTAPLPHLGDGLHGAVVPEVSPGARYRYRLHRDGHEPVERPDPASRWQPDGVHGPSAVDEPATFAWTDQGFRAKPMHEQVLYELHVGTFSAEGTFDGAITQLPHLVDLGITTIELMPVWQFPGDRNWGYDGVLPSAVQDSYGGPDGLRRLVDAAHASGIAVILDVVHNHLGPEGNHLAEFGGYTTDRYSTPWGPAMNVDGPGSDHVRRWIIESVVGFVRDHHLDGFRLDAVHGIIDQSALHLLEEMSAAVHAEGAAMGKPIQIIAESDLCDPRLVRSPKVGGFGLDGQWADDFHHAVHVTLTGERDGYYSDYQGLHDLEVMLRDRYLYAGRFSPYRQRTVGRPGPDVTYDRFVVCVQNHDQVGNRMLGERLSELTDPAGTRFAAAMLLTSPFVPMLFMGEEHADPAPFQYFVAHTDPGLSDAVREGRQAEFADFAWRGEAPDPTDPETFERCKIDVGLAHEGDHGALFSLYKALIALRGEHRLITDPNAPDPEVVVHPEKQAIALIRRQDEAALMVVANGTDQPLAIDVHDPSSTPWQAVLDTGDPRFAGPGVAAAPEPQADGWRVTLGARTVVVYAAATGH